MDGAKGDGELIADLKAQPTGLRVAHVDCEITTWRHTFTERLCPPRLAGGIVAQIARI
jgi:hypothetical protein